MKQNSKLLGKYVRNRDINDAMYLGNTTNRMKDGIMLSIMEDEYDVAVYVNGDRHRYVDLSGVDVRTAMVGINEFGGILIADESGRNVTLDKKEVKHLYKFLKKARNAY